MSFYAASWQENGNDLTVQLTALIELANRSELFSYTIRILSCAELFCAFNEDCFFGNFPHFSNNQSTAGEKREFSDYNFTRNYCEQEADLVINSNVRGMYVYCCISMEQNRLLGSHKSFKYN